ncbi:MAG: metallophosphoesterase, partial [Thiomonas sp.]
MTRCIAELPDGPLDLIGDVHGHWDALRDLLGRLGYDAQGRHPQGRRLVFVGDLIDRGPDSPAVLDWVFQRVREGRAWAVMGNHELNLLRGEEKEGNDWFWNK